MPQEAAATAATATTEIDATWRVESWKRNATNTWMINRIVPQTWIHCLPYHEVIGELLRVCTASQISCNLLLCSDTLIRIELSYLLRISWQFDDSLRAKVTELITPATTIHLYSLNTCWMLDYLSVDRLTYRQTFVKQTLGNISFKY